ncbi:MAG: hypothetical protein ACRCVI_02060 [Mycoplasmoidaceae bacterium]
MSSIKTGSHISRDRSTFSSDGISNEKDYYGYLPQGLIPFCFNIAFFIAILLCGLLIPNEKLRWNDAFVIASYSSFCMNVIWFIFRQDTFSNGKYQIFSMWKKSFAYKFRERFYKEKVDYKKNILDADDYDDFLKKRRLKTKLFFWISFYLHVTLVVVSTILSFAL